MEQNNTAAERKMTIHDMSGAQVKELVFTSGGKVSMPGLPCGTYIIRFMGGDGNPLSNKLVILRS